MTIGSNTQIPKYPNTQIRKGTAALSSTHLFIQVFGYLGIWSLGLRSSAPSSSRQPVKYRGQLKILFGQSPLIMGGEGEGYFVPADINVRVMPGFFRRSRHGVDKLDRGREILELECATDGAPLLAPLGRGSQSSLDLGWTQFRHERMLPSPWRGVTAKSETTVTPAAVSGNGASRFAARAAKPSKRLPIQSCGTF